MKNVLFLPSTNKIQFFIDNQPITGDIVTVSPFDSKLLKLDMEISGLNEIPSEKKFPLFINFFVYETNYSTGRGVKILKFFNFKISTEISSSEISSSLYFSFNLLSLNKKLKPMEGGFESDEKTYYYDFKRAFISLNIFYSQEDINSEIIDRIFPYDVKNVVFNSKIPIKQSDPNE